MAGTVLIRTKKVAIIATKVVAYLSLLGLIALGVAVSVAVGQLPGFDVLARRDNLALTIRVRALDGTIIHSQGPSFGEWIPYERIPVNMRNAMIAIDDRRYDSHLGVDPIGMARSVKVRWDTGEWRQGASTITQQLARNIFLTNTRTFGRKMREGVLAMALEWSFTKEQILELYLNRVYFGGGAYGIDAASRRFFGHSATELSLEEAAIIAGLVKAPSNYSPTADIEAARGRAGIVLAQMQEQEMISAYEASAANPQTVPLARSVEPQTATRYFTDWVLPQLETMIDPDISEPLEVWTTIDIGLQAQADRAIAANVPSGAQGALVSLDRDGAVRAMVGGLDYVTSNYNRATQANRQPGSAWKLFVYLSALENGHEPESMVSGAPITVQGWSPRNDSGGFPGDITLRQAFALSVNTAAVRLSQEVGIGTVASMAKRFGISTPISNTPSMALGSSEVRLIDLTRAYAAIARKGMGVAPYGIRRVTTGGGTVVYEHRDESDRALVLPHVAAHMTDLLQSVVENGTGRAAALGRPTAGKTGTTTSSKDGWFVGFSSGMTTGVWIGRDDNKRIAGLAGGRAPAQAFKDYMSGAVANRPAEPFETEVATPEWQLDEPVEPLPVDDGMMVDEDGGALPSDDPLPADEFGRGVPALPSRPSYEDPEPRDPEPIARPRPSRPLPNRTPPRDTEVPGFGPRPPRQPVRAPPTEPQPEPGPN